MNIRIKYFGMLAEATACNDETIDFSEGSIEDVLGILFKKYPALETKDFQVAQNQILVTKETFVSGEEIALLPPFSGG